MIITLIGADFSKSNIGTLSSWIISRVLGDGATYAGPSYVDKDAALSATVTLDEGYEIGSAGITIIMGGAALDESCYNVVDNVITFTIASVTGSVVIKVPTLNTNTGEEDGGESGDGDSGDDTGTITTYQFKDQAFVGYLSGGNYVESAKSATTDYIDISSKPKIGYYGRMGYVAGDTFHALEFYDANKTYLEDLSVLGTGSPMYQNIDLSDSKYENAKYVRASVSQSSYPTEEFNAWYFVVGSFIEEAPTLETLMSMFPSLGYISLDGTDVEASSNAYRTDYVALDGKTSISYKGRMGTIGLNMAFYDNSKNMISGLEIVGDGNFITQNINLSDSKYANAAYVKASISKGTLDETTWLSSSFKIT